jgi:uncharacterized protein YdhG (YjbR/CyaY superfamily)
MDETSIKMETTSSRPKFKTVSEYMSAVPPGTKTILQTLRKAVKEAAPDAEEMISYNIPTLKLNGTYLIYFAGYKEHVSLYPIPNGNETFKKEISPYVSGKGTIKFPIDKPLPLMLITKIVKFSIKANEERATAKLKSKNK